MHVRTVSIATFAIGLLTAAQVSAQAGKSILLVSNALSQPSAAIADYYAGRRAVPTSQLLRLTVPLEEEVSRREYEQKIEGPIARWLSANAAQDRILYIVLTKDIPLRIAGTVGTGGTIASVDSELTLLYRRLTGVRMNPAGSIRNPYFLGEAPASAPPHFTHRTHDMFLVGRLDGYTVDDVKAMIDKGLAPARQGTVVLDGKLELSESVGNKWLATASTAVRAIPGWDDRVILDRGQTTLTDKTGVIGFYTWGSNAVAATLRHFGHTFVPGAIAGEYVSTDGRTFKEPPEDWAINDTKNPFGGSHQSLIGDLIRDGVTGVAGHVAEPYLNATIRPDILFPSYVRGANLIEAFYLAMPSVSWQTVVIGDVLCSPFGTAQPQLTDINPPMDPVTELPAFFSARRVATFVAAGTRLEAAKQLARADSRDAKGDLPGMRKALEDAIASDPSFVPAQLSLAAVYETAQEWDPANELYRQVLTRNQNHAVALNNLAYSLAVHKNDAASALPLAKRAYAVSVSDPAIGDTLAWIHHLLGDDASAAPIITAALRRGPTNLEFRLHAAFILAATDPKGAADHLEAAIKGDAALANRDDVRELRARLQKKK
jgi:uncharacterized protein (TIGR03790 family)